eukprot:GFYU01011498.1.p2 GENE.GFYU01011498.1~~GFYU01011498.1.p2  ORF type:complete len:101 (+),score=45.29 GFYU01011498.1:276-578(+)
MPNNRPREIADHFKSLGANVSYTVVNDGYDIAEEVGKLVAADFVFYQSPVYWFSVPAAAKKWMDDVFTSGPGILKSDGRTAANPQDNYGTGGLLNGHYMM